MIQHKFLDVLLLPNSATPQYALVIAAILLIYSIQNRKKILVIDRGQIEQSESFPEQEEHHLLHSIFLERELLISSSRFLDYVNVHEISCVNVALACRCEDILNQLQRLFARPAHHITSLPELIMRGKFFTSRQ